MAAILGEVGRHQRASGGRLHLVPSENRSSLASRLPHLAEAALRYAFPGPGGKDNWAWPGTTDLLSIERYARQALADQLDARFVNLKPVSGVSALTIALSALAGPGDVVWNIGEGDGGHGSTRFIGDRLGLSMRSLPFDPGRFAIDMDRFAVALRGTAAPTLVYLDAFMCLFPHDLAALRQVLPAGTVIHYDASHTLGLIAGGAFQSPLREGADTVGGSTHKTYPGPHKGVLATNSREVADRIDLHASHFVSHHHPADVAALAIAAAEMTARGPAYAHRTVDNARHLGRALTERGFHVCAASMGYTACHQLWIDIAPHVPADTASRLLYAAGLVVNAIPIPYLSSPGLRLGVQEATWTGMGVTEMDTIADVFADVLRDGHAPERGGWRIRELIDSHICPPDPALVGQALTLIGVRR